MAARKSDTRYFLSDTNCTEEYHDIDVCLVAVSQKYLKHLYRTYAPLFHRQPYKRDGLNYIMFMNGAATFGTLDRTNVPNMVGIEKFFNYEEQLVEVPADTFKMLEQRFTAMKGYYSIRLDDYGLSWEASEKHSGQVFETQKFWWTELGLKRKPKPKEEK